MPQNFLRHYYDVYCLLGDPGVQAFLGTEAYVGHKDERFPAADNKVTAENDAFELSNQATRARFARAYAATSPISDRNSVVKGKSVSVRVQLGCRRFFKKTLNKRQKKKNTK